MAWTDLTFSSGSKLTSTKMIQVQNNFAALAGGESGAPPLAVNSFMASGVSSLGLVNADSGYMTSEVGSFGGLDVSSAIAVQGSISVGGVFTVDGAQRATQFS